MASAGRRKGPGDFDLALLGFVACLSLVNTEAPWVETALVMPVILLLMTGIFSFSIALYQKLELAHGVASGARFLSTDKADVDPCEACYKDRACKWLLP